MRITSLLSAAMHGWRTIAPPARSIQYRSIRLILPVLALLLCGAVFASAQKTAQRRQTQQNVNSKLKFNTALLNAIKHEDADLVDVLLMRGADPNSRDASGQPALILAFTSGKGAEYGLGPRDAGKVIVQTLLDAGADVNCHDAHGVTPLMLAMRGYDLELLTKLLRHKPRIDQTEESGNTALMLACLNSNERFVQELLDRGANINVQNKQGLTPIGCALVSQSTIGALALLVRPGTSSLFKYLVDRGADLKVKMPKGMTLLMLAAVVGNLDAAALLLERGLEVNARGDAGVNALSLAIYANKAKMVKLLLAHGADPNLAVEDGTTPLMIAAERGSYAIVERLLKSGAIRDTKRADGTTALMVAERTMNTAIANLIKQAEARK